MRLAQYDDGGIGILSAQGAKGAIDIAALVVVGIGSFVAVVSLAVCFSRYAEFWLAKRGKR